MLPKKFAFVDIETTGTSLTHDRIIEIGILRVENNTLVDSFETLINPQTTLPPFIETMTGISTSMLENAPTFSQIKDDVLELLQDSVFVAHNVRFDYGFLKHEFHRNGKSFSQKHLCTVRLSRLLYPRFKRHNLDSLIERFGFSCERRHRAYDDAKVLWDFFQHVQQQVKTEKLTSALTTLLKRPSLPTALPIQDVESLPELPGVYIFYGEKGMPLYIGKSVNIRDRVMSHFSSDSASSKQMNMCQQINNIETRTTSGELGALLLEATLIKEMQPLYNRKLRHSRKLTIAKRIDKPGLEGYFGVELSTVDEINPYETDTILGVYKSIKQAKTVFEGLVKEYSLCEKLLGLQATGSVCFSYHLGYCKGACNKEEPSTSYNTRFLMGFAKSKLKAWPFTGPILIEEKGSLQDKKDTFVVDQWCVVGKVVADEEGAVNIQKYNINFDVDTYRILNSYLNTPKNTSTIKKIPSNLYFTNFLTTQ